MHGAFTASHSTVKIIRFCWWEAWDHTELGRLIGGTIQFGLSNIMRRVVRLWEVSGPLAKAIDFDDFGVVSETKTVVV